MAARSTPNRPKRSKHTKNIEELKRKNTTAMLQWSAIAAAILLLLIAVFVFGWGTGDGLVQHSG
jgi:uncharacterized integral membrane protein